MPWMIVSSMNPRVSESEKSFFYFINPGKNDDWIIETPPRSVVKATPKAAATKPKAAPQKVAPGEKAKAKVAAVKPPAATPGRAAKGKAKAKA